MALPVQSILRSVCRLVIFLCCCLAALAQAEDDLRQAAAAQERGEYRIAAEAYARALTTGYDSAELRSNYGMALYLAGEDVKALEQFRIALHRKARPCSCQSLRGVVSVASCASSRGGSIARAR